MIKIETAISMLILTLQGGGMSEEDIYSNINKLRMSIFTNGNACSKLFFENDLTLVEEQVNSFNDSFFTNGLKSQFIIDLNL